MAQQVEKLQGVQFGPKGSPDGRALAQQWRGLNRAATFVGGTTALLAIASGATAIRFAITPQTSNMTFDVLDAWVMPRGQQ